MKIFRILFLVCAALAILAWATENGKLVLGDIVYSPLYWEDIRIAGERARAVAGTSIPDFVVYKTNGAGSRGVFTYRFDHVTDEEVFFMEQLPHSYKLGTDLYAHAHWAPIDAGAGTVRWCLEYTWAKLNGTFGNTQFACNSCTAGGVGDAHQLCSMGAISGVTNNDISSMLICRFFRDADASTGGTDTYGSDAVFLEFDFHFQIDSPGSRQELVK